MIIHALRFARTMSLDNEGSGGSTTPPAQEPATFSVDYVRELRGENKGVRLDRDKWKAEAETLRLAADKATKDAETRIADANTAANQRIIRSELKAYAVKAGIRDLDALRLADLSKVSLTENGEVEGADALIESLKTSKPYLFADASAGTTTGTTSQSAAAPKPAANGTKSAKDMTPEEYKAAKAAMGL